MAFTVSSIFNEPFASVFLASLPQLSIVLLLFNGVLEIVVVFLILVFLASVFITRLVVIALVNFGVQAIDGTLLRALLIWARYLPL